MEPNLVSEEGARTADHRQKHVGTLVDDGKVFRAVDRQSIHSRKLTRLRRVIDDFEFRANAWHKAIDQVDVEVPPRVAVVDELVEFRSRCCAAN